MLFDFIKDIKDFNEARKKYINNQKSSLVCGQCRDCKFLKKIEWDNGRIGFGCKIDPYKNVKNQNYKCDYRG